MAMVLIRCAPRITVLLAGLAGCAAGPGASAPDLVAQYAIDAEAILLAVGDTLRTRAVVAVGPRISCPGRPEAFEACFFARPDSTAPQPDPLVHILASQLKARVVPTQWRVGPPPCKWGDEPPRAGAGVHIEISAPVIQGDSATLMLVTACDAPAGHLHNVVLDEHQIVLRRVEGRWRVVQLRMTAVT